LSDLDSGVIRTKRIELLAKTNAKIEAITDKEAMNNE
jgi:hypothetical protein